MRNMVKQTAKSSFFISSPFVHWGRQTPDELVEICRHLASTLNLRTLHRIARLIENPIGRYYEAIALNRWGEPAFYHSLVVPDCYRARTLLSAAQSHRCCGHLDDAFRAQVEATRLAYSQNDYVTFFHSQRELAILSALDGDHQGALSRLESLLPLGKRMRRGFPIPYLDLFNSLAVELGELRRFDEAFNALSIALASPFVIAYPEWLDTRAELIQSGLRASRSVVAIGKRFEDYNVLPFAIAPAGLERTLQQNSGVALVRYLDDWKMATNKQTKTEPQLTQTEKQQEIIHTVLDCNDQELDALREFLKTLRPKSADTSKS
jgi:hypothetical protein